MKQKKALQNSRPTIGFQISNLQGKYGSLIWPGIVDVAQEKNLNLIVFSGETFESPYGLEYQHNVIYDFINAHNLDAIVLASNTLYNYLEKGQIENYELRLSGIPQVSIGMQMEGIPSVLVDNKSGVKESIRHLIQVHGIKRIAYIRGPQSNSEAEDRFAAYCETLEEFSIPLDQNLILQGDFAPVSGRRATQELLDRKVPFEGLVSANDDMMLGALEVFRQKGIRIPMDVALIGYDNIQEIQYLDTPLTTVRQPLYEIGKEATNLALDLIQGKSVEPVHIFQTQLVVRPSCGCLPESIRNIEKLHAETRVQLSSKPGMQNAAENKEQFIGSCLSDFNVRPDKYDYYQKIFERFYDLFWKGIESEGSSRQFLNEFRGILANEMHGRQDISEWQEIVSRLRESVSVILNPHQKESAENILHDCRLLIASTQFQQISSRAEARARGIDGLLEVTQKMISTLEADELTRLLTENLPSLGIRCCFIALYERESKRNRGDHGWKLPEYSNLILAYDDNGKIDLPAAKKVFPSRNLVPNGLLKIDRCYNLVLKPIFFNEDQLGFMLFEATTADGVIHETLRLQISSALKGSLLFRAQQNTEKDLIEVNAKLLDTNEKLKDLDRAKTDFFSNVSHELRTPLTLILGPIESILSGDYGDNISSKDALFQSIYANGNRLLKLINHLLDFSKIEAGKMQLKRKRTNINNLLNYYTEAIRSAAESRGLVLELINSPDTIVAWIDRELIENAVFNLLSNAMKFTPEGGKITVELAGDEQFFIVKISDTGIGIPEEKYQSIFERFTQLDSSASRKFQGTGIGLAFTKEIVELHGGRISVTSLLGKGSSFKIEFPYWHPDEEEEEQPIEDLREVKPYLLEDMKLSIVDEDAEGDEKEEESDGRKILIVDDNAEMRRFLKKILEKQYQIITARNGQEGLSKASALRPDVILSDVMMPEMDGYELTRRIKSDEELKSIPIILLTAKSDVSMRIMGLELGADDYLSKPFNAKELQARIRSSVEMKKLRDNLAFKKEVLEQIVKEQTQTIEEDKNYAIMLQKKAEKQLEEFLLVLASAIESKDAYTGGHVERVAKYARDLAVKVGLNESESRDIYLGAIVHDVGKIGIRDSVLNKTGVLNDEEKKHIQAHTVIGQKLLSRIENIETAVQIAYCHQEKWDGSGYPRGIRGEAIPLVARIVTVADYWDSIVTDRPYRKAMDLKKAISIMHSEREKAFDPYLLDIFMNENDKLYLNYVSGEKKKELFE